MVQLASKTLLQESNAGSVGEEKKVRGGKLD
jgi:hypothetical protein